MALAFSASGARVKEETKMVATKWLQWLQWLQKGAVATVFFIHRVQIADRDHTFTATGGCLEIDQRTTRAGA